MLIDVFGQRKKHEVMADTWGHLYPEPGSKHEGHILVMHHDGKTMMLDRNFKSLDCSPIEYELVCSIIDMFEWTDGLHKISCTLWFYKTCNNMYKGERVGKIIKAKVKTLYSTDLWPEK